VVLPYRGAALPPFVGSRWAPGDGCELLSQAAAAQPQRPASAEPFATPASVFSMQQFASPAPATTTRHLLFSEGPSLAPGSAFATPAFFTPGPEFSGFKQAAAAAAAAGEEGGAATPGLFGVPRFGGAELEVLGRTPGTGLAPRSTKRLRATPLVRPR
jgi:hypothetical protein